MFKRTNGSLTVNKDDVEDHENVMWKFDSAFLQLFLDFSMLYDVPNVHYLSWN